MSHLENHILHKDLKGGDKLHVVSMISNPARWHSRYRLARAFAEEMAQTPGISHYSVEIALGDHHHEVTDPANPSHLQLRTNTEIWAKENAINLGVRHLLPRDWKYVAWVDADISFRNPHWAQETLARLQTYAVIQPWEHCLDLGPNGSVMATHRSFGAVHQSGARKQRNPKEPYQYAHPGFCWAATRAFWEQSKGLIDWAIVGSGDHHMSFSMIGEGESTVPKTMAPSYFRRVKEWQDRVVRITHKQVGFVPGRLEHHWHGAKANRRYRDRWQILVDAKYDPDRDVMYDEQGLVKLCHNQPDLEQAIRQYNRGRNEDGLE